MDMKDQIQTEWSKRKQNLHSFVWDNISKRTWMTSALHSEREGILCYTRLQWYLWLIQSIDKHLIIKYIPLWSKQQFKDPVFNSFELVFVRIDADNQLISLILKVWSLKPDNVTAKDKKETSLDYLGKKQTIK